MCAEENLQVVNCTTPANYFHVLRRQMRRDFRKPLIALTPKSLLRDRRCVSPLAEFGPEGHFRRVLPDPALLVSNDKVRRLIFCSGKVYYDLLAAREQAGIDDVALVRVEQLYPWPKNAVAHEIARHSNADIVWCQEEPANMGAWSFVFPRLLLIMDELKLGQRFPGYVGRASAAAPATGFSERHKEELSAFLDDALHADFANLPRPFVRQTLLG